MTQQEVHEWLRQENAALRQENQALREELEVVKAHLQKLQGHVSKDSRNSSKPPSSDGFKRWTKSLRKKSGKKLGAQKGHAGHHLQRVEEPDAVIIHEVSSCGHCEKPLADQPAIHRESRQIFDVPPKVLWVVEHLAEEKRCRSVTS